MDIWYVIETQEFLTDKQKWPWLKEQKPPFGELGLIANNSIQHHNNLSISFIDLQWAIPPQLDLQNNGDVKERKSFWNQAQKCDDLQEILLRQ